MEGGLCVVTRGGGREGGVCGHTPLLHKHPRSRYSGLSERIEKRLLSYLPLDLQGIVYDYCIISMAFIIIVFFPMLL